MFTVNKITEKYYAEGRNLRSRFHSVFAFAPSSELLYSGVHDMTGGYNLNLGLDYLFHDNRSVPFIHKNAKRKTCM